MFKFAREEPNV